MQHRQHAGQARLQVGGNIYWASPVTWSDGRREVQAINAADVVSAWADEAQDYHYASNTYCKAGKQCGHYTQVVWRDTKQVGCGMSLCPNQAQIWVCNYDPAVIGLVKNPTRVIDRLSLQYAHFSLL